MMMSGLKVKGVLIDFGDTLAYTDWKAYDRYIEEIVAVVRENRGSLGVDNVRSMFTSLYRSSSLGEMKSLEDFWAIFLGRLGVPCDKSLIDRLERIRKRFYVSSFRLYEGVPSVLSVLRKKYRLGLVSNCGVGLMDVIRTLGLTEFFDVIVLSYEVGVRKPDERIYVEAHEKMKLKGDECVFVADEISDLEGARRLGMRTLLVRQGVSTFCEAEDLGFKPDFEVECVAQIVDFL
jgi:putative hydrolase of the HAD superfamily